MVKLSAHKSAKVRKLIEGCRYRLLYLPSYLNPIWEVYAEVKALLHKAAARAREALIEAMAAALWMITCRDASESFRQYGYRIPVQLP